MALCVAEVYKIREEVMRPYHSPTFFAVQTTLIVAIALAVACTGSTPGDLNAQVISGQIVDSVSGTPVGRGFAVLLDNQGKEVARALSDRAGRFSLMAPSAGRYWLRSERIGFRASVSEPLDLHAGDNLEFTLWVEALPVRLATLVVPGRDRCNTNPEEGASTVVIWEEIRKALAATAWGDEQELFHYRQYTYQRTVDKHRRRKLGETGIRKSGFADPPFRSVPAEQLASEGYIVERSDGLWYYLPDAHTLLDEQFLNAHCFHVVRDEDDRPGQVGLAFEPMGERRLPDVEGTLWLDESTSELRELDVRHTRVKYNVRDRRIGGTVRFMMLPSGAWIVREWQVRTPSLSVTEDPKTGRILDAEVAGFSDSGGEIYGVVNRDGASVYEAPVAVVVGTAFDSTSAAPLERAFVTVVGTDFRAHTDSAGVFELLVPLDGEYSLALSHPRVDSVAAGTLVQAVELDRDAEVEVTFAVPHVRSAVRRLCGRAASDHESRTIFGVVRRAGSGTPSRDASVSAVWQEIGVSGGGTVGESETMTISDYVESVSTDDSGLYSICGVPAGRPVRLSATKDGERSREASVLFPEQLGGMLSFSWDKRPGAPYDRGFSAHEPAWKVDLTLDVLHQETDQQYSPLLYGVVYDSASGEPVSGVAIFVNGSQSFITTANGRYELANVLSGQIVNHIEFRRSGYVPATVDVRINSADREILLDVALLASHDSSLTPL
jgi:hypothetical protein